MCMQGWVTEFKVYVLVHLKNFINVYHVRTCRYAIIMQKYDQMCPVQK